MFNALPSTLTASAQAATVALSGKAVGQDSHAGAGFARLMQQQTDLRQADLRRSDLRQSDQRLAQQRLGAEPSPQPHPVAPAAGAASSPAENRSRSASANPPDAASPAPSTDKADPPRAASPQDSRPARTALPQAVGAEAAAAADGGGSSPTSNDPANAASTAKQSVIANLARTRHAALAGWRLGTADAPAVQPGAPVPGTPGGGSDIKRDRGDLHGFDDPVMAPDSNPAAVLPNPAIGLPLAAAASGARPASGAGSSATRPSVALPGPAQEGSGMLAAQASDAQALHASRTQSTAGWVAAQQRQRDATGNPGGDHSGEPIGILGTGNRVTGSDDATPGARRPAAPARLATRASAADGQPSPAAWAARVVAEMAPNTANALPAAIDSASASATASAIASATPSALSPTRAPAAATDRDPPRMDDGPDAADVLAGAPAIGDITAALGNRPPPSATRIAAGGGPAAASTGQGSEAWPARSAAGLEPSTQAGAAQTAVGTPQRPDAALPSGASAQPGAALATDPLADPLDSPETARQAGAASLAGSTRPDRAGSPAGGPATPALAGSRAAAAPAAAPAAGRDSGLAEATAGTRRTAATAAEVAVPPQTGPQTVPAEERAATANLATPTALANPVVGAGADISGGPRRYAVPDRLGVIVADGAAADAANKVNADREPRRLDRIGSGASRPESPDPTLATAAAPNAATTSALQAAVGAEAQPRANAGDSAALAGVAVSTAPSIASPASPASTAPAVTVEARIAVPIDSPTFAPALGAQISLFARDGVQTAQLQLNPAEMGPITVQIALDGTAARVDFQADRAATRDVIEASLPTLASAMQDAGLTLSGGGVFQQHPGRQPAPEHSPAAQGPRNPTRDAGPDSGAADPAFSSRRGTARGLVDLVA